MHDTTELIFKSCHVYMVSKRQVPSPAREPLCSSLGGSEHERAVEELEADPGRDVSPRSLAARQWDTGHCTQAEENDERGLPPDSR